MLLGKLLSMVQDAAAAALFTACKIEDTLKKSREILCAAYNMKLNQSDHLSPDDPVCLPLGHFTYNQILTALLDV